MANQKEKEMVHDFQQEFTDRMKSLRLHFKNIDLYQQALPHSNFINDFNMNRLEHNEHLGFLGDTVLELTVSRYFFDRHPHLPEGSLTEMCTVIVCEPSFVILANRIKLSELILLGKGKEETGNRARPSPISDVFRAFVGAPYLDQGLGSVWTFAEKVILPYIGDDEFVGVVDFETQLQGYVHSQSKGDVTYQLVKEEDPTHHRLFTSEVILENKAVTEGKGKTKKESERRATE